MKFQLVFTEKQEIYGDGNDLKRTYGSSDDLIQTPAADRNKGPILEVLQQYFSEIAQNAFVFEVASGPGQHIVHFAQHFPSIVFLPSDCDLSYLRRYV